MVLVQLPVKMKTMKVRQHPVHSTAIKVTSLSLSQRAEQRRVLVQLLLTNRWQPRSRPPSDQVAWVPLRYSSVFSPTTVEPYSSWCSRAAVATSSRLLNTSSPLTTLLPFSNSSSSLHLRLQHTLRPSADWTTPMTSSIRPSRPSQPFRSSPTLSSTPLSPLVPPSTTLSTHPLPHVSTHRPCLTHLHCPYAPQPLPPSSSLIYSLDTCLLPCLTCSDRQTAQTYRRQVQAVPLPKEDWWVTTVTVINRHHYTAVLH